MSGSGEDRCPLCGEPLYGWVTLPAEGSAASVGLRVAPQAGTRVIDRCEACGVAVERGRQVDLEAELRAVSEPVSEGAIAVACPNRGSLQAALGGDAWSPLDRLPGRLALTPRSLSLLAERNGYRISEIGFPPLGPNQLWMWQTLVNALTFHNNFAREAGARRLRAQKSRGRWAFAVDAVVTILAAPLVAVVSIPLEAIATLVRRGGRMRARAEPRR